MTFVAGQVPTAAELNAITTDLVPGEGLSWTPTLTQSATPTKTVEFAWYTQVGDRCFANVSLAVTSAGTAANQIIVGLPPLTFAAYRVLGVGAVFDASTSTWYSGLLVWNSATTARIIPNGVTAALGAASFTAALASGDLVAYNINARVVS